MKKVLIAVGGSGQHVVHAYLRLLTLSNVAAKEVPDVFLIDADAKDHKARATDSSLASDIKALFEQLVSPLPATERAHFKLIVPYFVRKEGDSPRTSGDVLKIERDDFWANALLLNDGQQGSKDHEIDVADGMMANARIGASVFGSKLVLADQSADLSKVNFGTLLSRIRSANVAIVGSSFGGTGSGVIPALVRYLDKASNGPRLIRAFMTLPWFEIDAQGGNQSAASSKDGIDPMTRNSALGLRTYLDELTTLQRANYVVAQFSGPKAVRADNGNFNQTENKHVFNLVLATSIQHFLHGDDVDGAKEGTKERKLFGLLASNTEESNGVFNARTSPHLRVRVGENDNRSLEDLILDAEIVALALEKGAEYILPGKEQFKVKGATAHKEPVMLRDLLKEVASQTGTPTVKRGVILKLLEVAPDAVYKKLFASMTELAVTLRRSLLWLDAHKISKENPAGIKLKPVIHLFAVNDFSPIDEIALKARWDSYGLKVRSKDGNTDLRSSPPRAQAFSLFLNIFSSANNLDEELRKALVHQEGEDPYKVTAQLLAAHVYKEVIEARNEARHKEFQLDNVDKRPVDGDTSVMLRGNVDVGQNPETSRLCHISGRLSKNSFEDEHPLNLRLIDPYYGVSSIDVLLKGTKKDGSGQVFPETAIKGIPNILAPMFLQKWRLECGDIQSAGQKKSLVGQLSEAPSSTSYGLYLHGRRVIEAAFWLLFTRDKRVQLSPDIRLAKEDVFSQLITSELSATQLKTPSYIKDLTTGDILFVNDPHCGWFLGASHRARQFFAEIMPELPSVKYGSRDIDILWRGNNVIGQPQPEPGSFDANIISAFSGFLNGLAMPVMSHIRDSEYLWVRAVHDLSEELEHQTIGLLMETIDNASDSLGKIELHGRGEVTVHSPSVLGCIESLFIEKPVFFYEKSEGKSVRWQGVWPVRGAAWEFVSQPNSEQIAREDGGARVITGANLKTQSRSVCRWDEIRLHIKGVGTKTFKDPFGGIDIPGLTTSTQEFLWSMGLWPNFQADKWRYYIAGGDYNAAGELKDFDLLGNSLKGESFKLVFYGDIFDQTQPDKESSFGQIGVVEQTMPIKLNGVPRSVEIWLGNQVLGSLPIELKTLQLRNAPDCSIALDFGTSNTCMAIMRDEEGHHLTLPMLPGERMEGAQDALPDFTFSAGTLTSGADKKYSHQTSPGLFYQSFNHRDNSGEIRSIPSELLFVSGRNQAREPIEEKDIAKLADKYLHYCADASIKEMDNTGIPIVVPLWTPFPPNLVDDIERAKLILKAANSGSDERFVDNFKWRSAKGWESRDRQRLAFRAAYLEGILVSAFASLRWMGHKNIKSFVATYPGAFELNEKDIYEQHLGLVTKSLTDKTGLKINESRAITLRSETISALASCHRGPKEISLTIDMGGGTTDIGFIVPGMKNFSDSDEAPASYMASLRYAGNDLLSALLKSKPFRDSANCVSPLALKVKIRQKQLGSSAIKDAKTVSLAFFEAMFEYVFNMISAFSQEESFPKEGAVSVYFFGNGFKLIEVLLSMPQKALFEKIKKQAVECGLLTTDMANRLQYKSMTIDPKLALIQGAFLDQKGTPVGKQHDAVEKAGHGRIPLWLPCVQNEHSQYSDVTCGTWRERDLYNPNTTSGRDAVLGVLLRDEQELRAKSFPLTSKYWKDNVDDAIFNNIEHYQYPFLGKFYLEGGKANQSFAAVVLSKVAELGDELNENIYHER